jgi:hypothetical protein
MSTCCPQSGRGLSELEVCQVLTASWGRVGGRRWLEMKKKAIRVGGLVVLVAALLVTVVKEHPFVDGNKRVGHAAMETFLV